MSVIAVTLSNRTQKIRSSVRDFYLLRWPKLTYSFPGKRTLKHIDGQVDREIEDFRSTLLELHKAFVDEASVVTEITALQILDDVGVLSANVGIISANMGIMSAGVGRITSQLDGMATKLKWLSSHVLDSGT